MRRRPLPRLGPRSIRVRLALWYSLTLALILIAYAAIMYGFLHQKLTVALDENLRRDMEFVESSIEVGEDGKPHFAADLQDMDEADVDRWIEVIRLSDDGLAFSFAPPGRASFQLWLAGRPRLSRDADKGLPGGHDPDAPVPDRSDTLKIARERSQSDGSYSTSLPSGTRLRVFQKTADAGNGVWTTMRVARSERPLRRELADFLRVHGLGLPIAILVAGIGGYAVTRRALSPLHRMAEQAERITAAKLSDRLPVDNPADELGHLAMVFNDTFSRLERSFNNLRQFTADASHELRTPLTAIKAVGEEGLRTAVDAWDLREVIGSMLEETDRMARLVDSLLTLARSDGGKANLKLARVDLAELAQEVVSTLGVLAEEKSQDIVMDASAPVYVLADRLVLRQAVVNLLDNAIKHTPEGGRILIGVRRTGGERTLEIEDSGPGIVPEHRDLVFERFYRVDKGRSREMGGTGLGLSIAKWAVESHGGRIDLLSARGSGCLFRIVLPGRDLMPADKGSAGKRKHA